MVNRCMHEHALLTVMILLLPASILLFFAIMLKAVKLGTSVEICSDSGRDNGRRLRGKRGKRSPYSITERRVPELIPVLGSQPTGDVSPLRPLRGLLPVLLLGEQRHNGCEQFA